MKHARLLPLTLGLLFLVSCASPEGNTAAEKRAYTLKVRDQALSELYVRSPDSKAKIEAAPGYVFASCFAFHPGFMTFGNGYGIVQDNKSGKQTFVRLTRFAVGPGLAVKGYYAVVTLPSAEAVAEVAAGRWYGTAFADATFKFGDTGGSASAGDSAGPTTEGWLWTHTGVSIEAAAGGGKMYPEEDLN